MSAKWLGIAIVAIAGATACSDGTGPAAGPGQQRVGLMVSTAASPAAAPGFAPESVKVGTQTLVFDKVELVLREIELERVEGTAACGQADGGPAASDGDGQEREGNNEAETTKCFEFAVGPIVIDVPLGGEPERIVTIDVDTGNYGKVEFKLHRPIPPADQALIASRPDLEGISVMAKGTYNGVPFTFTSKVSAKQEHRLDPKLVVGAAGPTDLTLQIEIGSWFIRGGVGLIDPATAGAGGLNEQVVAENIKRSFRVFEDRNHDGREDR